MKRWVWPIIVIVVMFASGCGGLNKDFVRQSRQTYNRIADKHLAYTKKDPNLSKAQKKDMEILIKSWDRMITRAEAQIEAEENN